MGSFRHVLIAICYAAVATAAGLALPRLAPGVDGEASVMAGGVIFIAFAVLHEVFARQGAEGRLAEDLTDLRLAQDAVSRELSAARGEVTRLHQALTDRSGRGAATDGAYDALAAEVRVLQDLVDQLSADRPPIRLPAPRSDSPGIVPVARGLDDAAILSVVRDGLRADRIDLYLQPIVTLPQRQRRYFEAYTRIRDGEGKMVVPDQYISIAEREGLVTAIDNMLLFRCVQLIRKSQRRNQNLGVFCNISAHTLADRGFLRDFVDFMARNSELAPDMIFEFPQSTIANRDAELEAILKRLGAMGFRFSMDQVSSFRFDYEWLAEHRFKFVKIDAPAMCAQLREPTSHTAMRNMKRILRTGGAALVVEKLENESDLLELLDFQVDYGQGYLFGEPRLSKA
jgi:cyclic-di-GMP phosphodiesterase, flagellum assembly factor TipF